MGFLIILSTTDQQVKSTIKQRKMVEALKSGMTERNTQVNGKKAYNMATAKNKIH